MTLPYEDEDDRRAHVETFGEQFDTGKATKLLGIPLPEYRESSLGQLTVANPMMGIECLTSDVAEHELVKQSKVTRVSDSTDYFVKDFEPDGTGMTVLRLRR